MTPHAILQMKRRDISEELVMNILASPEQVLEVRPGRNVFQSRVRIGDAAETCLVRVFVDVDRTPPEIVTAYRTSKISRYWRKES